MANRPGALDGHSFGLRSIGRALRHRNYRLFFAGQSLSLIGTWLTRVATAWLVYRLTHSALLLGIVGFSGQIPIFLVTPLAGVMVDRWNRHRVLLVTQVAAMLQSALLAGFAISGTITVAHVIVLAMAQGVINAFDMPARQAFVVEMVEDREDLPNAIALNSSMVNAARLIGPMMAGALIALFGEGGCFAIDSASYLFVIASLLAMRVKPRERRAAPGRILSELRGGLSYVAGSVPIRAVLLLLALASLMGFPYIVLMPVMVTAVLGGGPHLLGFLTGAAGSGALLGGLFLASRKRAGGLEHVISSAALVFGLALAAFSRSEHVALSLVLVLGTGAGMMVQLAASNTLIQTLVDEDMRGRVMSFYTLSFLGTAPFGSLLSGSLAARIGAPNTLLLDGLLLATGAVWFRIRAR
jgi:MFS family permease